MVDGDDVSGQGDDVQWYAVRVGAQQGILRTRGYEGDPVLAPFK